MSPGSIAVVGASDKPGPGRNVLDNLSAIGFPGSVHVVNKSGAVVRGRNAFPSLGALPEVPDLVVVAVNSAASISVVSEAAHLGVKGAVLLASGFAETGQSGAALAQQVPAKRGSLSLVGPNCLGFINLQDRVAAYSGPMLEQSGRGVVGLVSNSGALSCSLTGAAAERGIAFSHVITTGNQLDLGVSEFVSYLTAQEDVRIIACYLEGFTDGRALLEAFDGAARSGKTVVVLKAGRSDAGGEAARTHTGALAGSVAVQRDLFAHSNVIMAGEPEEFLALIELGERLPRPVTPPRVAAVTISGGERLLLADAGEELGLNFAVLGQSTLDQVSELLPPYATASNPLDTTGAGIVESHNEAHAAAVLAITKDANVDLLLACQDGKNGWVQRDGASTLFLNAVRCAADAGAETGKPVVVISPTTGAVDLRARELLNERGIACLVGLGPALRAFAKFSRCAPGGGAPLATYPVELAGTQGFRLDARTVMERLAARGVPHWPTSFVRTADEAVRAASQTGYPIVLKLEGGPAHRKAAGGMRIGMKNAEEVAEAWKELASVAEGMGMSAVEASLQRVAYAEAELFVGAMKDDQFGPIVLFGLGGTDVEQKERWVVGLAPLTDDRASVLIERFAWWPPVLGKREGASQTVRARIARVIRAVSEIICDPDVCAIDINPLLVLRDGLAVIDAKMVVYPQSGPSSASRS